MPRKKETEISFEGSELQTFINNCRDNAFGTVQEQHENYLSRAKSALEQYPKSKFWKDAILYLETKLAKKKKKRGES